MDKQEFRRILTGAVSGNNEDLEQILELYKPLINRNSYVNGQIDEDLRQHLMLHIIQQIKKFSISL